MRTVIDRHKRVALSVDVTMVSESNFYTGLANNISEGGLFVATYMPPPVGTVVEIAVELGMSKQAASFNIRGQVQWIRSADESSEGVPAGCGLQFVALPKGALDIIREFVAERDTIFYECVA